MQELLGGNAGESARRAEWIPMAGGLSAAALLVALLCRPHGPMTSLTAFALTTEYLLYALAFSIVGCYVLEVKWRHASGEIERIRELAACAVWLAPLAVCRVARPWWMIGAAVPLAIGAGRLFSARDGPDDDEPARISFAALIAACVIEAALVAVALDEPAAGTVLLGAAAALVAWKMTRAADLPPGDVRLFGHTMLAFLLTLIGLMAYVRGHGGGFPFGFASEPGDSLPPAIGEDAPGGEGDYEDDVLRGVILWPELKRHTVLVPPMPALPSGLFHSRVERPLSIPFFGVYWFYRRPDSRPPKNSLIARGSPAHMSFRSTDRRPLIMEAHQNLLKTIDVSCCSRIDVGIDNQDRYAGTVTLELILVDTRRPGHPSESLGEIKVTAPAHSVLHFGLPATGQLRQFDELAVRFHLYGLRVANSARIEIERFVLVPRALLR